MNPKPFSSLNHFTVPIAMCLLPVCYVARTLKATLRAPGAYTVPRAARGSPCGRLAGAGTAGGWSRFSTSRTPATLRTVALDALDLLGIVELPAQDHDPAVGVDADRSLGNRPVAEQFALDLAHQTDVIQLRCRLPTVGDRCVRPTTLPAS